MKKLLAIFWLITISAFCDPICLDITKDDINFWAINEKKAALDRE